jgi:hypothetical protein
LKTVATAQGLLFYSGSADRQLFWSCIANFILCLMAYWILSIWDVCTNLAIERKLNDTNLETSGCLYFGIGPCHIACDWDGR